MIICESAETRLSLQQTGTDLHERGISKAPMTRMETVSMTTPKEQAGWNHGPRRCRIRRSILQPSMGRQAWHSQISQRQQDTSIWRKRLRIALLIFARRLRRNITCRSLISTHSVGTHRKESIRRPRSFLRLHGGTERMLSIISGE